MDAFHSDILDMGNTSCAGGCCVILDHFDSSTYFYEGYSKNLGAGQHN